MPDINNALAAQIQPPASAQMDPLKTISALSQLELARAHAGLYGLQAQQMSREYNALQHSSEAYKNGGDAGGEYIAAGGQNPAYATALQGLGHQRDLLKRDTPYGQGLLPAEVSSLSSADSSRASAAKTTQEAGFERNVRNANGGYSPGELSSLATTQKTGADTAAEIYGKIGTVLFNGRNQEAVDNAAGMAITAGMPRDTVTLVREKLRNASPDQIAATGQQFMQYGMGDKYFSGPGEPFVAKPGEVAPGREGVYTRGQITGASGNSGAAPSVFTPRAPGVQPSQGAQAPAQAVPGQTGGVAPGPATGGVGPGPASGAAQAQPPGGGEPLSIGGVMGGPAIPGMTPQDAKEIEGAAAANVKQLGEAKEKYQNANAAQMGLYDIQHSLTTLGNKFGWYQGPGAGSRVAIAKAANTALEPLGYTMFDPKSIAASESANKQTTRLGFDLAKTLGSREAAMIVQQAVGVQPGIEMSPEGARKVTFSLVAAAQRDKDYYSFQNGWRSFPADKKAEILGYKPASALDGADVAFNAMYPPQKYVQDALALADEKNVPLKAIEDFQAGKGSPSSFDRRFGPGLSRYLRGSVSVTPQGQ